MKAGTTDKPLIITHNFLGKLMELRLVPEHQRFNHTSCEGCACFMGSRRNNARPSCPRDGDGTHACTPGGIFIENTPEGIAGYMADLLAHSST